MKWYHTIQLLNNISWIYDKALMQFNVKLSWVMQGWFSLVCILVHKHLNRLQQNEKMSVYHTNERTNKILAYKITIQVQKDKSFGSYPPIQEVSESLLKRHQKLKAQIY